ncbi:MAG: leucine-rich repeat protein [Lawsonibacter sp.]|nr:leucine-rich repeat protein [Lawsonibacter sp.]
MKKKILSLALALAMCLSLLPVTASAAEANLPDWYFLFAIFKNVDADYMQDGIKKHTKYSMTQDEVDVCRDNAKEFEEYMNSVGVMRAHVEVVEIDETITKLADYGTKGGWLSVAEDAPLLEKSNIDLDRYDHVTCIASLNASMGYLGLGGSSYENGTGHSFINIQNREYCLNYFSAETAIGAPGSIWPPAGHVHEFLHFMERMTQKWGAEFGLHNVRINHYSPDGDEGKECYRDIMLNRAKGAAGTGVHPAVWQYPPHVLRTMTELTVPSSATSIGIWAFGHYTDLTRVFIPTNVKSIEYAAFWDTGIKDVYYAGTEAQWKAIQMGEYNEKLTRANIHYNHLMADVKTTDWFAKYVQWAMGEGIAAGTGGGKFSPGKNCTVAEIMTFLYKAYGGPEVGKNPYINVKTGDWYAKPAIWAHEKGLVTGNTFSANTPCTRAMVVEYLWKLAGSPSAQAADFEDVPANASYAQAVNWAVANGVTAGVKDNQFGPDIVCTRSQIVTFLYSALA